MLKIFAVNLVHLTEVCTLCCVIVGFRFNSRRVWSDRWLLWIQLCNLYSIFVTFGMKFLYQLTSF